MSKSIYHYCSLDTFMSIIENKSIRLSDLNKTNDYMEKKWAASLISEVLKDTLVDYGIRINLEDDYWYDDQSHNHLQYYENELKRVLLDESLILISCFSEEKDSLSQWRAYGQDGSGIAIGFNLRVIKTLNRNRNISVEKIVYKSKQQKERLGSLIKSVIEYIKGMYNKDKVRISDDFNVYFEEEFDAFCEVLIDYIGEIGCTIKNPAFSEEKEVRIIKNPHLPKREIDGDINLKESKEYFEDTIETNGFKIGPINFISKNNQLVAFCDISFAQLIHKSIISEIVIGPKSKVNESDIYYSLLAKGFDGNNIKISRSSATYR